MPRQVLSSHQLVPQVRVVLVCPIGQVSREAVLVEVLVEGGNVGHVDVDLAILKGLGGGNSEQDGQEKLLLSLNS